MKALIKPVLLLLIAGLCLFEFVLARQSGIFHEFEVVLLQTQWMLLVCLAVWCGTFLFLTFSLKDLSLIGLLIIAIAGYFISQAENRPAVDAITLLFGVTLGKGARFFLSRGSRRESALAEKTGTGQSGLTSAATFLTGLVLLLAFASWWHLDMANNFYHGPRWMGLWNNPNDYGLLMGAGLVLAVGLLTANRYKRRKDNSGFAARERKDHKEFHPLLAGRGEGRGEESKFSLRSLRSFAAINFLLLIAAGMMGVGLLFSYSRGAWLGTAVGLLFLTKAYGKFKWRLILPPLCVAAAMVCILWNNTSDTAPWYVKRMDLGRPSALHRVVAWKAGFEIIRDHPLGVGWNKAIEIYAKNYSPPEGGAAAITTNDYLMLGTQLGLPGLICFVAYVALCLGSPASRRRVGIERAGKMPALPVICRAATLATLTAFWFDGGLFKLATAAVFWILLELGSGKWESGNSSEIEEVVKSLA
jgi:hypothetical protein